LGILANHSAVTFTPWGVIGRYPLVTSFTDFPDGSTGNVEISAGTKSIVRINMKVYIFEDNTFRDDTSNETFHVDWDVSAARDGTLTIDPNAAVSIDEAPTSSTVGASLASVNPAPPGSDYVRINPIVSSAGGSASVSPVGIGVTRNVPGLFVTAPFTLHIHVKDIPSPEGKVTLGPIEQLRTSTVLFPPPKNLIGQDAVSSSQEHDLIRWYQGLNDRTRQQIETGATPILIEGHASITGGDVANRELSNRRMENVKRILSQFAGNRAVFHTRSVGAYEAKTPGESQEERKVVVWVWERIFEGETPAGRNAP